MESMACKMELTNQVTLWYYEIGLAALIEQNIYIRKHSL
jgi:hypothetical protein